MICNFIDSRLALLNLMLLVATTPRCPTCPHNPIQSMDCIFNFWPSRSDVSNYLRQEKFIHCICTVKYFHYYTLERVTNVLSPLIDKFLIYYFLPHFYEMKNINNLSWINFSWRVKRQRNCNSGRFCFLFIFSRKKWRSRRAIPHMLHSAFALCAISHEWRIYDSYSTTRHDSFNLRIL